MELTWHIQRILTRKFAAALLLAVAAVCLSGPSYAAVVSEDKTPEADRTINDLMEGTILGLLEIEYGVKLGLTEAMKKTYEDNYKRDHEPLQDSDKVKPTTSKYGTIAENAAGYRGASSIIYSGVYRDRENKFRDAMRGVAEVNAAEAEKIAGNVQTWIKKMNQASRNADGYIQLIQAGTQEANYLNVELAELRADTLRQIDVHMRAAVEEAQDDFDETSAFEGAVRTWKSPGSSSVNY